MKQYLIITADDFGFSKERNQGVIEAYKKSAVTSASLLLNCTGTNEAADYFTNHDLCAGLHLNLTEGHPLSRKSHLTLTDPSGNFWGKFELRKLLDSGKIDPLEIRHEIECQIEFFTEIVGRKPSYVDGHQHIHVHPAVSDIFATTLHAYGIQATRLPIEMSLARKPWVAPGAVQFYNEVMDNAEKCRAIFGGHGIRHSHSYVGMSTMGSNMTIDRLQSSILAAFQKADHACQKSFVTCELMTHPGYATGKDSGGFDGHSDDFGCSMEREHEIRMLTSKEMFDFYQKYSIDLVSHEIFQEPLNN